MELWKIILIVYLAIGLFIVISDARQPRHNQPMYIRNRSLIMILLMIQGWFFFKVLAGLFMRRK